MQHATYYNSRIWLLLAIVLATTTAFRPQEWAYSCELASLVNALEPLGIQIDEAFIRARVPIDPRPRGRDAFGRSNWADPNKVIVGDIRYFGLSNGVSYGVFPRPMARAARAAGAFALAVSDMGLDELRSYAGSVPASVGIEIWGTLGWPRNPDGWYAEERWIEITSDPHVYNVVRMDGGGIVLGDPALGVERWFSWERFSTMWSGQALLLRRDMPFSQAIPGTDVPVGGLFLELFRSEGGVAAFGLPLAPPQQEGGRVVQYFERAVMELQPEATGAPTEIQLRRLGVELRGVAQPISAFGSTRHRRFFAETGHTLAAPFLDYWEQHGARAIFGLPIGEPEIDAHGQIVQWFERARLELTAEGTISRGLLGQEAQSGLRAMPDLRGYGETQAREHLQRLGITRIIVDYQGRERLGALFDSIPPYAVLSHLPAPWEPLPADGVVTLGVRAP